MTFWCWVLEGKKLFHEFGDIILRGHGGFYLLSLE